jgi:hypothetical protein
MRSRPRPKIALIVLGAQPARAWNQSFQLAARSHVRGLRFLQIRRDGLVWPGKAIILVVFGLPSVYGLQVTRHACPQFLDEFQIGLHLDRTHFNTAAEYARRPEQPAGC